MSAPIPAIITARGGSKGLPGKNILDLCGKPLIAYSIEAAKSCVEVSECFVSTDDESIAEVAREYGATVVMRPAELSTDVAASADVVIHWLDHEALKGRHYDAFALLQPTSPLRDAKMLQEAIRQFYLKGSCSLVSVTECEHHPYKNLLLDGHGHLVPAFNSESLSAPRQALPIAFRQNGAIYLAHADKFRSTRNFFEPTCSPYIMPSWASIDIDTIEDMQNAAQILRYRNTGERND